MTPETVKQMDWADPYDYDNWEIIGLFIIEQSRSYHGRPLAPAATDIATHYSPPSRIPRRVAAAPLRRRSGSDLPGMGVFV